MWQQTNKKNFFALHHAVDKSVDKVFAVAIVTTLSKVGELVLPAASGGVELEGPQEVGGGLEVGANSEDLVDEILHADNALGAQSLLDDGVVGQGDALAVDFGITALVDKLLDGLEVGVTIGNVGLDNAEHVDGGLVQLDKDGVVDLEQAEQLEHLADLGRDTVDTLDADHKGKLGLWGNVEFATGLGLGFRKRRFCESINKSIKQTKNWITHSIATLNLQHASGGQPRAQENGTP